MEKKPVKFVPSGGTSENAIASLLKKLAFAVFILGFIGGIVIGKTADKFHFEYAVVAWFSAFFLGALLLGVSELLSILQLHQTQSYIPCEYDPETDAWENV